MAPVAQSRPTATRLALGLLVVGFACHVTAACSASGTGPAPTSERREHGAASGDAAEVESHPASPAAPLASGPTPAELDDLAALCGAIDHDYIDGTLSDYYGGVKAKSDWGRRTREAGDAADRPGRHLEAAAQALLAGSDTSLPAACATLFDQLEELE